MPENNKINQGRPEDYSPSLPAEEKISSPPPLPGEGRLKPSPDMPSSSTPPPPSEEASSLPPPPPPMIVSKTPPTSKTKVIIGSIILFFLLVCLPAALFLVRQKQEIGKEAEACPPSSCSGSGYLCPGECDCNWELQKGVRWHYKCVNSQVESYNELDSNCDYVCLGKDGDSCQPSKEYSRATTPGYDCGQRGTASISLKICLPAGCPETNVSYNKVVAFCEGPEWANCEGACGGAPAQESIRLAGGQCETITASCGAPGNCGSCQVDIDGYGVRRWDDSGCVGPLPSPTVSPAPTPTLTPTPTISPSPPVSPEEYGATCATCQVYDEEWNEIKNLSSITVGQTVYFTTQGLTNHPQGLTKARFRINAGDWQETTDKYEDKFYIQYKVPFSGTYKVEAMVYNPELGWY